jgi:hypothetical protein
MQSITLNFTIDTGRNNITFILINHITHANLSSIFININISFVSLSNTYIEYTFYNSVFYFMYTKTIIQI